ncbi:MAG: 50S ribosomal protein L30 [Tissierellia bacterium]|nr:50S ribosomal protein L30 [Tissierellia bacterium]
MARLEITLKKSLIGRNENQRRIAEVLGLRRPNHTVIKPDNEAIRGMIRKIDFMLDVKEID